MKSEEFEFGAPPSSVPDGGAPDPAAPESVLDAGSPEAEPSGTTRRAFLGRMGATGAMTMAAGMINLEPLARQERFQISALPKGLNKRATDAAKLRRDTAQAWLLATPKNMVHPNNGDEGLYPNKAGNYSKSLPHNPDGTVDLGAYQSLLKAINSGNAADFDAIHMGGTVKLTSPQAGLAFDMQGPDAHATVIPPAPAFASKELAAEIVENYWMALLRDVPFADYASHPVAAAAAADLTSFGNDFKGPKDGGTVTPHLLFRGLTPGDRVGPWLSQYFCLPCHFGANDVSQKIVTVAPVDATGNGGPAIGRDYLTAFGDWLAAQNGQVPPGGDIIDPTERYMRMGRDIGRWVHIDVLFQGYFQAFLVLASLGAPVDDGNPYVDNPSQAGFATFGGPHIATLLCEVATRALKAVWFQKWFVHRRLRPEEFAGRIERNRSHPGSFDVHPSIGSSAVLAAIEEHNEQFNGVGNGTYLLPMAFPEGCPTHPAYGAGHATVAGACVTILKAWFDETTTISSLTTPVQPTPDGLDIVPYTGPDADQMTVGGELNKIASNVAIGRNIAGVHWRSDATESLLLGEKVAMGLLKDHKECYNEDFNGFRLTKFDGTTIQV